MATFFQSYQKKQQDIEIKTVTTPPNKKHQFHYQYQYEILNLLRILQDFDKKTIIQQKIHNTQINNNKNNICRRQKHQQAHKEQRNTQNIWPLMKYDVLLTK